MALRLRLHSAKQKIRPRSWAPSITSDEQVVVAAAGPIPTSSGPSLSPLEVHGKSSLDLPLRPASPSILVTHPTGGRSGTQPPSGPNYTKQSAAAPRKGVSWCRLLGHKRVKSHSDKVDFAYPTEKAPAPSSLPREATADSDTETLVDVEISEQAPPAHSTTAVSPQSHTSPFPSFAAAEKALPPAPSPCLSSGSSARPVSSSTNASTLERSIHFSIPKESHRAPSKRFRNHNLLTIEVTSRESLPLESPRRYAKTPLPRSPASPARRLVTSRILRAQTLIPVSQLKSIEKYLDVELPITPATSSGDAESVRELIDKLGHFSHPQSDADSIADSLISERLFEDRLLTSLRAPPPKYKRQQSGSGLSPIQASPRSPHRTFSPQVHRAQPRARQQPPRVITSSRTAVSPTTKSPTFQPRSRSSSKSTFVDTSRTPSDVESTYEERLRDIYKSAFKPGRLSTRSSLDAFPPLSPIPFRLNRQHLAQQDIFHSDQAKILHSLIDRSRLHSPATASPLPSARPSLYTVATPHTGFALERSMGSRKIWVKRVGGSATTIVVKDSDLVDDVKDLVLRKYGNSIGRAFDAPDINIRVFPRTGTTNRSNGAERLLGPDETITEILDSYFATGQRMEDALVIELPPRKTPKASPRNTPGLYQPEELPMHLNHPHHREYFPPTAPHSSADMNAPSAMKPALPSPGRRRPKITRNHTKSPTNTVPDKNIDEKNVESSDSPPPAPDAAPMAPTEPVSRNTRLNLKTVQIKNAGKPNEIATSPRPFKPTADKLAVKVDRQGNKIYSTLPTTSNRPVKSDTLILEHSGVPPINVLLVEDNAINLRLLEAFMKKLKVRYKTAVDGVQAIDRWREGGFHLVLMDIQLPKMNGLDATRSIRNLETESGIGLGASLRALSNSEEGGLRKDAIDGQHTSPDGDAKIMSTAMSDAGDSTASGSQTMKQVGTTNFKSPVIIVALTASSLESDRHEALAAGCNDFLTKPVNYMYLERKVMEWGCMQALIDFDGWRQWKIDAKIADEAANKEAKARAEARALARAAKGGGSAGDTSGVGSGDGRARGGARRFTRRTGASKSVSSIPSPLPPPEDRDTSTPESQTATPPARPDRQGVVAEHTMPGIHSSSSNDSTTGYILSQQQQALRDSQGRPVPGLHHSESSNEDLTPLAGQPQSPTSPGKRGHRPMALSLGTSIHGSNREREGVRNPPRLTVKHDLASPLGRALSPNPGCDSPENELAGGEPGNSDTEEEIQMMGSTTFGSAKFRRFPESASEKAGDEPPAIILPNGRLDLSASARR